MDLSTIIEERNQTMETPTVYLGKKGYSIVKKDISEEECAQIRNDLTVKPFAPPNSIQQPKSFSIYRESPKKLYVPRFYGIERYGYPGRSELSSGEDIDITFAGSLRDYQKNIIDAYLSETKKTGCGLLEVPCGRGKCLGYDTPVALFNGTTKMVQDITNRDILIGDDHMPRIPFGFITGMEMMYYVYQNCGMMYRVNESHILTLFHEPSHAMIDIELRDYMKLDKREKTYYKGIRKTSKTHYILSTINVVPDKIDEYYGFQVNKNHRFLLGDYTVTHNTVMALNIISQLQKKTLVIVHKEFLMNQWIERIEQFLPDARVGRIQGPTVDIENKDIVIGMLQSLSMKDYDANVFDGFGLTIADECLPGDTFVDTNKGYIKIRDLEKYLNDDSFTVTAWSSNYNSPYDAKMTNWWKTEPKNMFKITFQNGETFVASHNHRVYVFSAFDYYPMEELEEGDILLGLSGQKLNIVEIEELGMSDEPLYDIEVDCLHNFFAWQGSNTPILVHNCHHISAEVFCRSLFKIVTPYMLGLSATMNRKDGLTKVFKQFLGNVLYKEERDSSDPVQVRYIEYRSNDEEFGETVYNFKGQTHYAIMIRKLCEFNQRSEFILRVLQDMRSEMPDQQVMILAHNKSLLKYLHDAIEHRNIATVGYYVGGMKEKALKETESKEVVIATYAMAEEALDIKSLASLIMATPKTDVTQAVGRILRMKHKKPIVVDIVDQHEIFQKQWIKRRRFYTKCNYEVIHNTNETYHTDYDNWEVVYKPGQKARVYKKKLAKQDKGPFQQGKCLITIDTADVPK